MLNAESVPEKKPGVDHAASTEPREAAWMACSAGTSAPGSWTLISMLPPEARATFFASSGSASPTIVRLVGKALARLMRALAGACAAAGAGNA